MPDSDWRQFLKDRGGLVLSLVVAAIFIAIVVIAARSEQKWLDQEAVRNAASYAADAKNDVAVKCVGLTGQSGDDCADEIDTAAREHQRGEYDLAAQQTMALWTVVMGGMAVLGVGLSGIGVYLIWGTWKQTAEAAQSARRTLDSYIWKERAHIRIGHAIGSQSHALSDHDGFSINLENVGLSPAQIVAVNFQYVDGHQWNPTSLTLNAKRILIPAGASQRTAHLNAGNLRESSLVGYVEYNTLKDQKFRSYFCFGISWREFGGLAPDHWEAKAFYPLGMPNDT